MGVLEPLKEEAQEYSKTHVILSGNTSVSGKVSLRINTMQIEVNVLKALKTNI